MENLSSMTLLELNSWLRDIGMPEEVIKTFTDNEMDGEALATLIGVTPGPDSLKELVSKIGVRLKLYRCIKGLYDKPPNNEVAASTCSESPLTSPSTYAAAIYSDKESLTLSDAPIPAKVISQKGDLPDPFPVPKFRNATEKNLRNDLLTDGDRKYMVQTLATMLMSHVQRPSLRHCLVVSKSLHSKFKFLGDDTSENAWKWFIYNRAQNINRESHGREQGGPSSKRARIEDSKHKYPVIPPSADDEESSRRNNELLRTESLKPKPRYDVMKELIIRTYPARRQMILSSPKLVTEMLKDVPAFKICSYMTIEFGLVLQRDNMREEFDEELLLWSKSVISYCRKTQKRTTSIQTLVDNIDDMDVDDSYLLKSIRCLCILLIHSKSKSTDGNIPYILRSVPVGTDPSAAPDKSNNCPHIVIFEGDELDQYFIAIEQCLILECKDIPTALFLLIASHYVFNISYQPKAQDFFAFIESKLLNISSSTYKSKSPVALSHINGITREHEVLNG